jgi:hypothetical protein
MLVLRISPLRVPSKIFQLPFFFCFGNLSKNLSLGLLKNIFGTSIILFSRHELSNSKICWGMCIYQYFFLYNSRFFSPQMSTSHIKVWKDTFEYCKTFIEKFLIPNLLENIKIKNVVDNILLNK